MNAKEPQPVPMVINKGVNQSTLLKNGRNLLNVIRQPAPPPPPPPPPKAKSK
jgi:hypothetical protein